MTDIGKKYIKMTQIEHILKRPGMYIGGVEEINRENWIFKNNKIIKKEIRYSPGLYKIFDELIVNTYDQTTRDTKLRNIKVNINEDNNQITVFNDGVGIDIVLHPKEKIYVPELIFGHLLTSTSFNENAVRTTGGIHGLGAKLTAVFSSYFKVEVADPINKKQFMQVYKKNLSIKSKPVIKEYKNPNGYVKITYIPDLKYFGIKKLSSDMISLMERRVYDIAAVTRDNVKVYLNNLKLEINNLSDYVSLFTNKKQIEIKCEKESIKYEKNRWKIIIVQSNSEFDQISFVNGINTLNGGFHVNYIVNNIVKQIREYVQKKYKTDKIKDKFIKNNIWIFISSIIENPTFSSQTKDELMTPVDKFGSTCIISNKSVKKIYSIEGFDDLIKFQINAMERLDIKKISVKRKSNIINIPKLYDANYAGTNKAIDCTLILTEGDSAKAMAVSGLSVIPKASNYYGVFPLKGKLINVRDVPHKKIIKNDEFINLKNILGLHIDKKYTKDNINELRYGSIILMMDADVDGSHIKGLFINMIHYYWPSLLKIDGFLKIFITPIVKATYKNNIEIFYNSDDYEKWKKKKYENKWNIKYYKGLGTNTAKEAKEYFNDLGKHILELNWNDDSKEAIELGFSKDKAENRKKWLKKYQPSNQVDYSKRTLTYYNFIHKELIHFSNYDNIRSIPNVLDGLKPSQRKVLYASFKRDLRKEIKVAQFVGYVSEHTAYHHGETSLANTIIGMAQNYVGSNNINLLEPKGQFGCVDPNTKILTWNGKIKLAKNIKINDKIVGDDGNIRIVSKITNGNDHMYQIYNGDMNNYIVNSNHILTVSYINHKTIKWNNVKKKWTISYYDKLTNKIRLKSFNTLKLTKKQAYCEIINFSKNISDNSIFDINIQDYLCLPKYIKSKIKGVINSSVIKWETRNIDIEPYILGYWLGNKNNNSTNFIVNNNKILKKITNWFSSIKSNIIIYDNNNKIRNNINYNVIIKNNNKIFYNILEKNNLIKNKHVPFEYIVNSESNRLKILAGLIDSCGKLYDNNNNYKYEIYQDIDERELLESFRIIAGSLGFKAIIKDISNKKIKLIISSDRLLNIPTIIYKNKIRQNKSIKNNIFTHNISIKYKGVGKFCGWNIDNNERFLLGDFTITHNTRIMGGKDHSSPRYIFTHLSPITRYIYRKEDDNILEYLDDDGMPIEPKFYIPIIPMILVNGSEGIGTGYSTYIPKFNPKEIIEIIKAMLKNNKFSKIEPWYRGFTGKITKYNNDSYITKGIYEIEKNKVIIKELPIGVWTDKYRDYITKYASENSFIKNVKHNNTDSTIEITIKYDNEKTISEMLHKINKFINNLEKSLNLTTTINLSNMHAYDEDLIIKKYHSVINIINDYFKVRLSYYEKRKKYILTKLDEELKILESKVKFVTMIINKKINIFNIPKKNIINILEKNKFHKIPDTKEYDYLISMPVYTFSSEKIKELKEQYKNKQNLYKVIKNKTINQMWLDDLYELESILK